MTAMGILPETLLGCEAAGVVLRAGSDAAARYQPGDRVVAQVRGAHATILRAPASLCEALPAHVSFAEAAAVGVVHTTAYHALVNVARLRRGQSVLVHAAAGGVGQAAVQLARHLGLEVYATCGSVAKRALLRERYGLPDERILHSRDASFVAGIRRLTGGRGVDCVLNSLAGELLRQGFYCLAPFGTFVELGMRDVVANTRLDMAPFARQVSFSLVNLWEAMAEAPELMAAAVRETFANLAAGVIQPPAPLAVHHLQAHQDAFRLMQAGKHLGKLVLSFEGCNEVPVLCRPRDALRLDPAATYLLVGGLGGLGRSLATMMADSGARHLAFISRSGEGSPHAASAVCELTQRGCAVRICQADVADRASLASALAVCAMHLPPIRGVVQMAMVLQDAAFANMTHAQWAACTRPKVQGTRNLDEAFADLDFFVVLSSCAGVLGNRGQANYAAAGAYQDELAGSRHARGLRAVSVDLGIMRDVGVLAETGAKGDLRSWEATLGIREPEFHGLMKSVINAQRGWTAASSPQLITGLPTGTILARHGLPLPSYLVDNPIFSHLARSDAASAGSNGPQEAETSIGARLRGKSAAKAAEVVTTALVDKVAEILQSPASEIDPTRSLYTYGIDSLVAMEVRSWIVREMKADVALFDVLAAIPMRQFAGVIVEKSKLLVKGVE